MTGLPYNAADENQLKLFTCAASFDFKLLALFW